MARMKMQKAKRLAAPKPIAAKPGMSRIGNLGKYAHKPRKK